MCACMPTKVCKNASCSGSIFTAARAYCWVKSTAPRYICEVTEGIFHFQVSKPRAYELWHNVLTTLVMPHQQHDPDIPPLCYPLLFRHIHSSSSFTFSVSLQSFSLYDLWFLSLTIQFLFPPPSLPLGGFKYESLVKDSRSLREVLPTRGNDHRD